MAKPGALPIGKSCSDSRRFAQLIGLLYLILIHATTYARNIQFAQLSEQEAEGLVYRSILEDSQGIVWLGTAGAGVTRWDGENYTRLILPEHIRLEGAASIHESSEGDLYFSGRGVYRLGEGSIELLSESELRSSVVFNITEIENGIWFFGSRGASYLSDDGDFSGYFSNSGLNNQVVHDGEFDDQGNLWLATRRGGLNIVNEQGDWSHLYTDVNCRKIFRTQNGDMWIGTSAGILHFSNGETEATVLKAREVLLPEFEGRDGSIWFTSEVSGVWKYHNGQFQHIYDSPSYAATELSNGSIVIASVEGIYEIEPTQTQ